MRQVLFFVPVSRSEQRGPGRGGCPSEAHAWPHWGRGMAHQKTPETTLVGLMGTPAGGQLPSTGDADGKQRRQEYGDQPTGRTWVLVGFVD